DRRRSGGLRAGARRSPVVEEGVLRPSRNHLSCPRPRVSSQARPTGEGTSGLRLALNEVAESPLGSGSPRQRRAGARPGAPYPERKPMKKDIHPEYRVTEVTCTCGNTFTTRSTAANGIIHADVCSNCHPFYTGKQKILDTGGRVARFEARYAKAQKK